MTDRYPDPQRDQCYADERADLHALAASPELADLEPPHLAAPQTVVADAPSAPPAPVTVGKTGHGATPLGAVAGPSSAVAA